MPHSYEELVTRSQNVRTVLVLSGHTRAVNSVAFSPYGRVLASGAKDSTVQLWEVETGRHLHTLEGHTYSVNSVAFSPDGRLLASEAGDSTVRLWEVDSGREIGNLANDAYSGNRWIERDGPVFNIAFSPNGRLLATGRSDYRVRLWDVDSRQEVQILGDPPDSRAWPTSTNKISFSPDGRLLATGARYRSLRLWEVDSGRMIRTFEHGTLSRWGSIWNLAFSPDGRLLASGEANRTTYVWDVDSGRKVYSLARNSTGKVWSVTFSPDGRLLASGAGRRLRFWDVESGRDVHAFTEHANSVTSVAFSPDGRLLASGSWDKTVRLWDITALDVGLVTEPKPGPIVITTDLQKTPLRIHLRSLPLCHVAASHLTSERPVAWLRAAAAARWPLPLALARDLGLLLSQPADQLTVAKPDHLPFDEDSSAYQAFLHRFAAHPLVRELPAWRPLPTDAVLAVVLARLVEGLDLPGIYRPPTGPAGVIFTRALAAKLETTDPAQVWRDTPIAARPDWDKLLPPEALARIERNLQALDREELRFLVRYGPPLAGSPDPRDLLDMLSLTGLPDVARLALSQTLKLLPRVSAARTVGGVQTYPEGGYEGLARKGSLDSLLLTELAYPEEVFLHRFFNHEALYYGRERPRERRRELAYVVTQTGWGLGGDGEVLARALLLALAQAMRQRGYEVLYSFAGRELSEPSPLGKPGEVGRMLYHREQVRVEEEAVLKGVLKHLRGWREVYRGRQVLWVLSEYFDADWWEEHEALYGALRAEGGQQAWFIHVGPVDRGGNGRVQPPPAARFFESWQVIETGILWEGQPLGAV